MDFDLTSFGAQLREAIHAGPWPDLRLFTAWRLQAGLPIPFNVVAIQYGEGAPPRLPVKPAIPATLLSIHPRLAYLCFAGPIHRLRQTIAPRHLLIGESRTAEHETRLIPALQQAIIALRRRELATLARKRGATPDQAAERQARGLALAELRAGTGGDALRLWLDLVLLRHGGHLHTIRRKQVELLSALTEEFDHAETIAYPFRAAMDRIYSTFSLSALAESYLADASRIAGILKELRAPTASSDDALVTRSKELIRRRFREDFGLADAARELGVSAEHLSRRFRRATGRTFTTYLTGLRLAHARERLADDDDSILRVALDAGFGSVEHFHRLFRKAFGEAPGAFRRSHRSTRIGML